MFEKATKMSLRFNTKSGDISVEDVWRLPLTSKTKINLDDLAKSVYRQIKECEEESFVTEKSIKNEILQLKLDIIKHIIKVKLNESKEADELIKEKERKQKIMNIINLKKDQQLLETPIEELEKML